MNTETQVKSYRFDIFKGAKDSTGKVHKIKSIGYAYHPENCKTYTIHLKSLLNETFYLLPEQKELKEADFVVLTREISRNPNRKYFWNNVGLGRILKDENAGFLELEFDLFPEGLYMNLHPKEIQPQPEAA
jgi:hypothetical protein